MGKKDKNKSKKQTKQNEKTIDSPQKQQKEPFHHSDPKSEDLLQIEENTQNISITTEQLETRSDIQLSHKKSFNQEQIEEKQNHSLMDVKLEFSKQPQEKVQFFKFSQIQDKLQKLRLSIHQILPQQTNKNNKFPNLNKEILDNLVGIDTFIQEKEDRIKQLMKKIFDLEQENKQRIALKGKTYYSDFQKFQQQKKQEEDINNYMFTQNMNLVQALIKDEKISLEHKYRIENPIQKERFERYVEFFNQIQKINQSQSKSSYLEHNIQNLQIQVDQAQKEKYDLCKANTGLSDYNHGIQAKFQDKETQYKQIIEKKYFELDILDKNLNDLNMEKQSKDQIIQELTMENKNKDQIIQELNQEVQILNENLQNETLKQEQQQINQFEQNNVIMNTLKIEKENNQQLIQELKNKHSDDIKIINQQKQEFEKQVKKLKEHLNSLESSNEIEKQNNDKLIQDLKKQHLDDNNIHELNIKEQQIENQNLLTNISELNKKHSKELSLNKEELQLFKDSIQKETQKSQQIMLEKENLEKLVQEIKNQSEKQTENLKKSYNDHIQTVQEINQSHSEQNKNLEKNLSIEKSQNKVLKDQIIQLIQNQKKLEDDINDQKQNLISSKELSDNQEKSIKNLQETIEEIEKNNKVLQEIKVTMTKQNQSTKQQMDKLSMNSDNQDKKIEEQSKKINEQQISYTKLKEQFENSLKQQKDLKSTIKEKDSELKFRDTQISNQQIQIKDLKLEIDKLQKQKNANQNDVDHLQEKQELQFKQIQSLNNQINQKEKSITDLNLDKEQYDKNMNELQELRQKFSQNQKEFESYQKKQEDQYMNQIHENEVVRKKNSDLKDNIIDLEEQIKNLKVQLENYKKDFKNNQERRDSIDSKHKIQVLENKENIQNLEAKLKESEEQVNSKTSILNSLIQYLLDYFQEINLIVSQNKIEKNIDLSTKFEIFLKEAEQFSDLNTHNLRMAKFNDLGDLIEYNTKNLKQIQDRDDEFKKIQKTEKLLREQMSDNYLQNTKECQELQDCIDSKSKHYQEQISFVIKIFEQQLYNMKNEIENFNDVSNIGEKSEISRKESKALSLDENFQLDSEYQDTIKQISNIIDTILLSLISDYENKQENLEIKEQKIDMLQNQNFQQHNDFEKKRKEDEEHVSKIINEKNKQNDRKIEILKQQHQDKESNFIRILNEHLQNFVENINQFLIQNLQSQKRLQKLVDQDNLKINSFQYIDDYQQKFQDIQVELTRIFKTIFNQIDQSLIYDNEYEQQMKEKDNSELEKRLRTLTFEYSQELYQLQSDYDQDVKDVFIMFKKLFLALNNDEAYNPNLLGAYSQKEQFASSVRAVHVLALKSYQSKSQIAKDFKLLQKQNEEYYSQIEEKKNQCYELQDQSLKFEAELAAIQKKTQEPTTNLQDLNIKQKIIQKQYGYQNEKTHEKQQTKLQFTIDLSSSQSPNQEIIPIKVIQNQHLNLIKLLKKISEKDGFSVKWNDIIEKIQNADESIEVLAEITQMIIDKGFEICRQSQKAKNDGKKQQIFELYQKIKEKVEFE